MTTGEGILPALEVECRRRAGPLSHIRREIEALHSGFTGGRGARPADYLRSAGARRAYLALVTVPNAARALHVLGRADVGLGPGERGLDAGSGPGASAIALAALSHRTSEVVLVDRSGPALALAAELFAALFPDGPRATTVRADFAKDSRAIPGGPFRTVVAGHLLNELLPARGRGPGRALPVARALARRAGREGALAVLEPAQRVPSRALCALRAALLSDGLSPVLPCTHAADCPVLAPRAGDWCVIDVPWRRPKLVEEVDRLVGTERRRLGVSCLVASRRARPPGGRVCEVLSEPMRAKGGTIVYLCGERGRLAARLPGPPSPPIRRGERIRLPEGARPEGRDRSGAPLVRLDALERV